MDKPRIDKVLEVYLWREPKWQWHTLQVVWRHGYVCLTWTWPFITRHLFIPPVAR